MQVSFQAMQPQAEPSPQLHQVPWEGALGGGLHPGVSGLSACKAAKRLSDHLIQSDDVTAWPRSHSSVEAAG